jgi:hypothetical protein
MHIYTFLTEQLRVKISLPKTNKTKKKQNDGLGGSIGI